MTFQTPRNISTIRSRYQNRSVVAENSVLRNTYFLLGLSLMFSALAAGLSMLFPTPPNLLLNIAGMYGLLFLVHMTATSSFGIIATFMFTSFMGYTLGPLLHFVVYGFANGPEIVLTTALCTGTIFVALSAYVAATRQSLSFLGGTLFSMLFCGIVLSLMGMLFQIPLLILAVNALFILVFSGLIMYHTSEIIHGGETNYILATISLYLALYNLFVSLLQIMMLFSKSNRD